MPPPKQGSPDPGSGSQRQHSRSSSMETVKIDPTDEDFEFMEPISPQTSPYEHIYLAGGQPRVARHNLAIAGLEPRSKEPASKVETPVPTPSNAETSPPTKPKTAVAKAYFYSPVVKYGPNGRYVQAVLDRNVPLSGVLPVSKREEADKKHEELVKKCNELGAEFTNILNLDGSGEIPDIPSLDLNVNGFQLQPTTCTSPSRNLSMRTSLSSWRSLLEGALRRALMIKRKVRRW